MSRNESETYIYVYIAKSEERKKKLNGLSSPYHDSLIRTNLRREFSDCERRTQKLLERHIERKLLEDPIPQLGANHAIESVIRNGLDVRLEILKRNHQKPGQLLDKVVGCSLHGLLGALGRSNNREDRLATVTAALCFAGTGGFDGMDDGVEAGVVHPEAVGRRGLVERLLQSRRVETDNDVIGGTLVALNGHGDLERL